MVKEKQTYTPSSNASTASDGEQSASKSGSQARASQAKRRASRAGTRCVSTLSSDQLSRKRANDREAQRAIRQRAKDHVESLERRIQELTQIDGGGAAALVDRNRELERELSELREKVIKLESGSPSYGDWPSDIESGNSSVLNATDPYIPGSTESRSSFPDLHTSAPRVTTTHVASTIAIEQDFKLSHHDGSIQITSLALQNSWDEPRQPERPLYSLEPEYAPTMASFPLSNDDMPLVWQPSLHSWEIPIRYLPPTGIVDSLLITVIQEQRGQASVDTLSHTRLSAAADMRGLLYSEQGPITVPDPISNTIVEVLHGTRMSGLPEKAACLYIMHKLLSWQISPLLDTYEKIPEWYSPRPSQLVEPHALWISQIPWPKLRDKVIRNQLQYATDEFQEHYHLSISVNWPYRDIDVLMFEDGEVRVTPMFASHVSKLENWSLNAPFSTRYPELADVCRFGSVGYGV